MGFSGEDFLFYLDYYVFMCSFECMITCVLTFYLSCLGLIFRGYYVLIVEFVVSFLKVFACFDLICFAKFSFDYSLHYGGYVFFT